MPNDEGLNKVDILGVKVRQMDLADRYLNTQCVRPDICQFMSWFA